MGFIDFYSRMRPTVKEFNKLLYFNVFITSKTMVPDARLFVIGKQKLGKITFCRSALEAQLVIKSGL